MTDQRPTASLRLMLSHPEGGNRMHRTSLRIIDDASNVRLAEIEISPEQFVDLMAGRGDVHVEAQVPGESETALLFRERVRDSRPIPSEVGNKYDYMRGDSEAQSCVDAWVDDIVSSEGWDTGRVVTGSQRFYAEFMKWLPRGEQADA